MFTLTKFKDNTFYWNFMGNRLPMDQCSAKAYGLWNEQIPQKEFDAAILEMNVTGRDVALFDEKYKAFLTTRSTTDFADTIRG
jgi:hypothetical protein